MSFREKNNCLDSIIYDIKNSILQTEFTDLTVLRSFSEVYSNVNKLPILTIEYDSVVHQPLEMGNNQHLNDFLIIFNIFAKDEVYKNNLADFLIEEVIINGFNYYNFSIPSNNPRELTGTLSGRLQFLRFIDDRPLNFNANEVHIKDRFRHYIAFTVKLIEL